MKKNKGITSNKLEAIDDYLSGINFNGEILIQNLDENASLFSKQYGYANPLREEKISPDTVFGLASVSKQFTAVAIMLLHEDKKIILSNPIGNYLDPNSVPKSWDWIYNTTVLELLEHKSGLPDDLYDSYNCSETVDLVEDSTVREHYHHEKNRNIKPDPELVGTYCYSNLGYSLLATLIEDFSQQKFSVFLKNRLFDKYGMPNTFVGECSYHIDTAKMYPQRRFADPLVTSIATINPCITAPPTALNVTGGGNVTTYGDDRIFSTCTDLAQWCKALYNGNILKQKTLSLMLENREIDSASYGLEVEYFENHTVCGHSGMTLGVATDIRYVKEHNLVIIVLSNVTANYVESIRLFEENPDVYKNIEENERNIIMESILSIGPSLAFVAARKVLAIGLTNTFNFEHEKLLWSWTKELLMKKQCEETKISQPLVVYEKQKEGVQRTVST